MRFLQGEPKALAKRRLSEETCRKWGYTVGPDESGELVQIAEYRDEAGQVIAQKIRTADKKFSIRGQGKNMPLYGMWLWRGGGNKVVVTEGELDALSVSQAQGNKWPVVSVPNGAASAKDALQRHLEWLEGYNEVILMFDMDEPGRAAAAACSELFTPGKCKVASLPRKDASECLQHGEADAIINAIWQAKPVRPDGILCGAELWDLMAAPEAVVSVPYPWDGLNVPTRGLRRGELVTLTAGTGVGKSQLCRQICFHLLRAGDTVGYIALEESVRRTGLALMGLAAGKPLHVDREGVSEADLRAAFDSTLGTGRLYLYDHFGSSDADTIAGKVRYLAKGCGCGWVILDHLSIIVSGTEEGDERRTIDNIVTRLRTLVQELNIGLLIVSHLKRPEGKAHEEGAAVSLSHLRGSGSIAQLSDMVISMERDQQDKDTSNISLIRVLKNRFTGATGPACWLSYSPITGLLTEVEEPGESSSNDRSPFEGDSVSPY